MKRIKIWSMVMLVAVALPMMVACGGDDDNNNNGSSYSSDEIVELLIGKWEIAGDFRISDSENKQQISGTYTGNIEFKANQKFTRSIKITVDRNDTKNTEEFVRYYVASFISDYYAYQILKKGGKNFICFDKTYNFEIRYLNKTTFYFEMDQDLMSYNTTNNGTSEEKVAGHVYMTMVTK